MDLKQNKILVGELLDNPASFAVIQKQFGAYLKHPIVPAMRNLSLDQLLTLAKVYVPPAALDKAVAELRKL